MQTSSEMLWKVAILVRTGAGILWCRDEKSAPHWKLLGGTMAPQDLTWQQTARRELKEKTCVEADNFVLIETLQTASHVRYVCEAVVSDTELAWFRPTQNSRMELRFFPSGMMAAEPMLFYELYRRVLTGHGLWPTNEQVLSPR